MAGSGGAGAVLAGFVLPFNRAMIRSKFIGPHFLPEAAATPPGRRRYFNTRRSAG